MRRLVVLSVLALGVAACGGSGAPKGTLKITFGTSGGTMIPTSVTIAPDGTVIHVSAATGGPASISSAEDVKLSGLVRDGLPNLTSQSCPGTFPDESAKFITALGKTVTVRGTCEPAFTKLWKTLWDTLFMRAVSH